MLSEVMEYYGFKKPLAHLGYFETEHHAHLVKELKIALERGRLVALTGIVGCGKTTTLQRLSESWVQSKEVIVSRSLTVDKDRVKLGTFITALFYDLSTEKDFKPPAQPEARERKLLELLQKRRKPVALLVDDAHDLHPRTLVGLKRLIELVRLYGGGAPLSIVLAGHPKLKNDLRRPSLEEIGGRASAFGLEGIRGHQREYIEWVLREACGSSVEPTELVSEEALALMATRLATPLQIEQYLTLAFEEAYSIGSKPVTPEVIETVLAQGLDELEPHLARNGYNAKVLAELLNVRTAEVRSFLHGQLSPGRTQDLRERMLKVGIPV
jgi:type II secretory pathway predicted ATPase ExeA